MRRELPQHRHLAGLFRAGVAVLAAAALTLGIAAPQVRADELDDKKSQIQKKLAETKRDLNESSKELNERAAALEASRVKLAEAQAQLQQTQEQLAAAAKRDQEMAAKLAEAQRELAAAKKAVEAGMVKLEAQRDKVGAVVQSQYQQKTNLVSVAVLTQSGSTRDMQTRVQWSSTMFDATESKVKELEEAQRALNAQRQELSTIEQQVAEQRKAAAENLKVKQRLEAQARTQEAQVASLVQANSQAKQAAAAVVEKEKQQYAQLESERAAVEKRIKERIAAEKRRIAEEKRKAAAAAAKRAAQQKAAQQKAAQQKKAAQPKKAAPRKQSNSRNSTRSSSHGFVMPVNGPITSPYGMRLHPVTGVYKLHDGTDFGAGCGTPIRAAYSGRVTERYWNDAWGNRLMIDHGYVDGRYVSTAYNHAIRYTVSVGQRVSTGQVIGYVGTTGWSTGCHLHYNLYLNGSVSNPMAWH